VNQEATATQPGIPTPAASRGSPRLRGGVDLGGTNIQAVVTRGRAKVLGRARRETPRTGGPEAVISEIAQAIREAVEGAGADADALRAVGVGSPGAVDPEAGTVARVGNVAGLDSPFPLADELARELGRPVRVANDVTAAVEAERRFGAGRAYGSFLGVFWGTGIGGGLVLDNRTWSGRGSAGELGHVVANPGGRRCACGLRGCVEAYAGRAALEDRARSLARRRKTVLFDLMRKRNRDRLTSGVWFAALEEGDDVARELLERAVDALGVGLGSALNLLDVEAVILGGGLGDRLGQPWLDRIEQATHKHLFGKPPEFRLAELGDLGGAIGASLMAP
jgi:glucokinase